MSEREQNPQLLRHIFRIESKETNKGFNMLNKKMIPAILALVLLVTVFFGLSQVKAGYPGSTIDGVVSTKNITLIKQDIPTPEIPTRPEPELLPQEMQDIFKDGISIEEFLVTIQGPIPYALLEYADLPVTVIVQLEEPSLIAMIEEMKSVSGMEVDRAFQAAYTVQLESEQDAVIDQIRAAGIDIVVISRYTIVLNGFMAQVSFKDINTIRALPGVKSVTRAAEHSINLSISVPRSVIFDNRDLQTHTNCTR